MKIRSNATAEDLIPVPISTVKNASRFKDLTGKRFGRLTVLGLSPRRQNNSTMWVCACDCGEKAIVLVSSLNDGKTTSCGCFAVQAGRERFTTHGMAGGGKKTREYLAWIAMRQRCSNEKNPCYSYYGGRGIEVCERWGTFENFLADMGECPAGMTIERKDVDGNYEPSNCKWATRRDQSRNTRSNRWITYGGRTQVITDWGREVGISHATIGFRLTKGWSVEAALFTPVRFRVRW